MSFDALVQKVKQAENALEAYERQGSADWRQFKSTWRTAWTPGRTVVTGLVSGFLVGRAQPLKHIDAAILLRLFSAVSSLLAIDRAQDAADNAKRAADSAEDAGDAVEDAAQTVVADAGAGIGSAPVRDRVHNEPPQGGSTPPASDAAPH